MSVVTASSSSREPGMPRVGKWLRAFGLRFAFAYWLIYCLFTSATQMGNEWLEWLWRPVAEGWDACSIWFGQAVLGISRDVATGPSGSGDRLVDWLNVGFGAVLALVIAVVWTNLRRWRGRDEQLRAVLRVVIRYTLGFILLGYGLAKVFALQFPEPSVSRLLQPYGNSSPMGLLWTFMGSSTAYQMFSGWAEIIGAVLLLSKRTTNLGALVLAVVLTNVVLMNFCYDVPVKLASSHYLLMCGMLLAPDARRLLAVVLSPSTTAPLVPERWSARRWVRGASVTAKLAICAVMITPTFLFYYADWRQASSAGATWYEGYWKVSSFARDGHDVPAVETDASRWGRVRFQVGEDVLWVRWRNMDGSYGPLYDAHLDEAAHSIRLEVDPMEAKEHPVGPIAFAYARTDGGGLTLSGNVDGAMLTVRLVPLVADDMLLVNRGFHWVSEEPFNR